MKHLRKALCVPTRRAFVHITEQVAEAVTESGVVVVAITGGDLDLGPWEQIVDRMLKKSIHGLFQLETRKTWFSSFSGFQSLTRLESASTSLCWGQE